MISRRVLIPLVVAASTAGLAVAGPVSASAGSTPAPPYNLGVYRDSAGDVTAQWRISGPVGGVVARLITGKTPPATPTSGVPISLYGPAAITADLGHLTAPQNYALAVWTKDTSGHYSARASLVFPTPSRFAGTALATLSGTVTDSDGHRLAGASVDVLNTANAADLTATTGDTGTWHLSVPAGQYDVQAYGPDATGGSSDATGYSMDAAQVIASGTEAVAVPTLALQPGGTVTGHVLNADGTPAAGVAVNATLAPAYMAPITKYEYSAFQNGTRAQGQVTTDASGAYTMKGVLPGPERICADTIVPMRTSYYDGTAAPRCATTTVLVAAQATSAADPIRLRGAGGTVSGVVTVDGVGQVDVPLYLLPTTNYRLGQPSTQTGAQGAYSFQDVTPGTYRVCADRSVTNTGSGAGYRPGCAADSVTVTKNQPTHADVVLPEGSVVSGRVIGPGDRPLAGVEVTIDSSYYFGEGRTTTVVTDSNGRYTINSLYPEPHYICAQPIGGYPGVTSTGLRPSCLARGATSHTGLVQLQRDLVLATGGAVSGVLTDASGRPVPRVAVLAEPYGRISGPYYAKSVETDAQGRFDVANLAAGTWQLCAEDANADGTFHTVCTRVTVTDGRQLANVGLKLPATGKATITVHDSSGRPVAGADVALVSPCHDFGFCSYLRPFDPATRVSLTASLVTSATGVATLTDVPAGEYAACVYGYYGVTGAGSPSTSYADTCAPGSSFDLDVSIFGTATGTVMVADGGAVSGQVTDLHGHALTGITVTVTHSAAWDQQSLPGSGFPIGAAASFGYYGSDVGPVTEAVTDGTGHYTIRGVTAGQQTVCFSGAKYVSQCYGARPGQVGGRHIAVSTDQVTSGIDLALTPHLSGGAAATPSTAASTSSSGRPPAGDHLELCSPAPGVTAVCVSRR